MPIFSLKDLRIFHTHEFVIGLPTESFSPLTQAAGKEIGVLMSTR